MDETVQQQGAVDRPVTRPDWRRLVAPGLLLFLALVIGIAFVWLAESQPNVSDTIGYLYAGERLASGHGLSYEDPNNTAEAPFFSLYAFQIRRPGEARLFLGFPPGFPLLLALAIVLTGQAAAAVYVVPVLAVLALLLSYVLSRLLTGRAWVGLWAAAILALAPAFWEFGTAAWSEVAALVVVVGAACLFLVAHGRALPLRKAALLSLAAGLLLAFGFFIRYANVAFLLGFVLYDLALGPASLIKERQRWPFYGAVVAGLASMVLFNHFYYGGPLQTSYSPAQGWYPQPAFSLAYALGPSFVDGYSLPAALQTLWANLPGLLLLVPAGWLWMPRPSGWLAAGATIGTVALYSLYAFAPTGVNSRFLLPALPFAAAGAAQALVWLGARLPAIGWRWAAGLAVLLLLLWPLPDRIRQLQARNAADQKMVAFVGRLTGATDPESVFLSYVYNDQIAYYGDRSVLNYRRIPPSDAAAGRYRWEVLEPCLAYVTGRLLAEDRPVYFVEDGWPTYGDALAKLQNHFQLDQVQAQRDVRLEGNLRPELNVYRLSPKPAGEPITDPGVCR